MLRTSLRQPTPADALRSFADLALLYREGLDFAVHVRPCRQSSVAILAPHGGHIEGQTSEIARLIAGENHGLYLFEGTRTTGDNFDRLHLGSHYFDEPRALALIATCERVVAIHGFAASAPDVLLGGLDERLKHEVARALGAAGLSCQMDGHRFPGRDPLNICNRGRSRAGVQIELSEELRRSHDWSTLVAALRAACS
jgi:phage replication-related protein YjqB (UPF0714/DUF867 family)